MKQEDSIKLILQWLKQGSPSQYPNYGYDIYLPNVIRWHFSKNNPRSGAYDEQYAVRDLYPIFVDAAWELCRRGIIRPGVNAEPLGSNLYP